MFPYIIRKKFRNISINIICHEGKKLTREKSKRLFGECKNVRVLGIESFVKYFLGIMDILWFCDFLFF